MTQVSEEYSLHNFQLAQPVQWKMMPQWNLHLILSALLWPPCSDGAVDRPSDDVIDQKWWTLNTTVLLLLATARRRSYLHALCVSTCPFTCGDVQNQLVVNLLPCTVFLAKNQMPAWSGSPVDTYSQHCSSQPRWARENVVLEKWCEYIT